jgi:hypothetical protein
MSNKNNTKAVEVLKEVYNHFGLDEDKKSFSEFVFALFNSDFWEIAYGTDKSHHDIKSELEAVFKYHDTNSGYTGGEGGGEDCSNVIKLNGKYYEASWKCYSYNGCEYDWIVETVREVEPVEQTVIVYKPV